MDGSFYKVDSVTVRLHEVEVLFQAHWVGLWRPTQRQEAAALVCELETGSVIDVILGMFLNFLVPFWGQYIHVAIATLIVTAAIVNLLDTLHGNQVRNSKKHYKKTK